MSSAVNAPQTVPFSYLDRQFANLDDYLADIRELVLTGDFTLGKPVTEFEQRFAKMIGLPYAIGVNSGTDSLILPMKLMGIGPGAKVVFELNKDGRRLVVVSCLDNLLKGAAGQAVQNMNVMCGWDEAEGLL